MTRTLGLAVLWILLALLASVPLWLTLPQPDLPAITEVQRLDDGVWVPATLPQARRKAGGWEHYRVTFELDDTDGRYLFIPVVSQRAIVELDGERIADTEHRTTMIGLASGVPALIPLPPRLLRAGHNTLDLHLQSMSLVPGYLSPLYIGSAKQLAPYYRGRVFLQEYLRLMVPAGQLLIALVVCVLWLYRPREALFGWLTLLLLTSMFIYLGMIWDVLGFPLGLLPYMHMTGSAASAILVITVLLIAGLTPPRWLKAAAVVVPLLCMAVGISGVVPPAQLVRLVNAPLNMLGLGVSTLLAGWAALRRRSSEAWLLLPPLLFTLIAALHDFAVINARLDGPFFLSVYYRPLLMIGIAMILVRRLGLSLNQLDDVNAYLSTRLRERERELERLHEEDRREAARRALSDERARLTADLHDGLSGHLASIIALSERERSPQVAHAAREALDDLRLVIHSLDIEDGELPVALAGLRERLERQLKRSGVELHWSMARLPEISGVTPSHALNVLRILQEAVTNAVRHGQATRIDVIGDQDDHGQARIVVRNDGVSFPRHSNRTGKGLPNMRRRIRQLNGAIEIEPLDDGTRLTVLLPLQLPTPAERAG